MKETVTGIFLQASDGRFIRQQFSVRDDLVALPANGLVLNQWMKKEDYAQAVQAYGRLSNPDHRKTYLQLASVYTTNRKAYEERFAAAPKDALNAFVKAGLFLSHTCLYAVDDNINRDARALKDRIVVAGDHKIPESTLTFGKLTNLLGGFTSFEVARVQEVFKDASHATARTPDPDHLAARLQRVSKIQPGAAISAATSFINNPKMVSV